MPEFANLSNFFTLRDALAAGFLLLSWAVSGYLIEHAPKHRPSMHMLMQSYRLSWMQEMCRRDVRIFDTNILSTLRQGPSFFGSACMIAIGGGLALLGQTDRLVSVAQDLNVEGASLRVVWEAKILLVIVILASAFLKFVWSHRLFGYCAVVMASVPNLDGGGVTEDMNEIARKAGYLNIYAARSFNRGLRAVYFALAGLSWLLGPEALVIATVFTLFTLYRREFNSQSRAVVLARR
ncbi:DUF599 domain-containing protein [Paroceanicella profunda]|uniref:DUF599 domain-containing protein n=2 Tax=Paroceanicella profunda TaxID=2579971 RepID=A0A5B8FIB1_9RHOB|nr:DUF599 domain-containing protein [Paroceanicella profunda]QDL93561.1 DUF599 domain-containing protein [Paroceanicella profunda]